MSAYVVEPVGSNTPFWGLLFGSVASTYLHARATLEYSTETRVEFAKLFVPSFFAAKKELIVSTIFLGGCWTVSRFITEKGLFKMWDSCVGPTDRRRNWIAVIPASIYLSSVAACAALFFARTHLNILQGSGENLDLRVFLETASNISSCLLVGAAAVIWTNR